MGAPATSVSARTVERRMRAMASPSRAKSLLRFFKSGPGEYGEGDHMLGLTLPQVRNVAAESRGMSLPEIERLLQSRWHEVRLLGLIILTWQYPRADADGRQRIYRLYLRRTDRINNWDLVDVSAPQIVGAHLMERPRAPLRKLARSRSLWERRIAIVATLYFIRHDEFGDTLEIARMLLHDDHDLIHKATGWMLREVGKRDERALRRFLVRHAGAMPRTMLRYAIERFTPGVRRRYMTIPRTDRARATPRKRATA